jgi:hypothetical protein
MPEALQHQKQKKEKKLTDTQKISHPEIIISLHSGISPSRI